MRLAFRFDVAHQEAQPERPCDNRDASNDCDDKFPREFVAAFYPFPHTDDRVVLRAEVLHYAESAFRFLKVGVSSIVAEELGKVVLNAVDFLDNAVAVGIILGNFVVGNFPNVLVFEKAVDGFDCEFVFARNIFIGIEGAGIADFHHITHRDVGTAHKVDEFLCRRDVLRGFRDCPAVEPDVAELFFFAVDFNCRDEVVQKVICFFAGCKVFESFVGVVTFLDCVHCVARPGKVDVCDFVDHIVLAEIDFVAFDMLSLFQKHGFTHFQKRVVDGVDKLFD